MQYITTGQSQEMVFTDYVPDYSLSSNFPSGHGDTTGVSIDINQDSVYDFRIRLCTVSGHFDYSAYYDIYSLNQSYILTETDTVRYILQDTCFGCTVYSVIVAKKFQVGDTLYNTIGMAWKSSTIINHYSLFQQTQTIETDYIEPIDSPYYYFLKIIKGQDTLLGYLHFSTHSDVNWYSQGQVLDFACEGVSSTHVISSLDRNENRFEIFLSPNPFTSTLSISLQKENLHEADFTITNIVGQPVYAKYESNLSSTYTKQIDLSYLPAGVYFLEVIACNERVVRQLIKQQKQ